MRCRRCFHPALVLTVVSLFVACGDDPSGPGDIESDGLRAASALAVVPNKVALAPGQSVRLVALHMNGEGSVEDAGDEVGWSTSDHEIAEVSEDGMVYALEEGTVRIRADCNGTSSWALVMVTSRLRRVVTGRVDDDDPSGLRRRAALAAGGLSGPS